MRVNWDYIAGFFDGEGSVSTMCFTHRLGMQSTIVTLSQSGNEGLVILTAIRDFLWERGIKGYMQKAQRRPPHRVMYNLKISARPSVVSFLQQMLPLVSVKFVVVQDTLRFYKIFPSLRGPMAAVRNRETGKYGSLNLDPVALRADLAAGMLKKDLAAKHGTNTYTINKYLDPSYRQRYDEYRKQWRAKKIAAMKAAPAA